MFLTPYFSKQDKQFEFTRRQASHFAKKVAADFNPIHDEDSRRFCVPGDLLFSVILSQAAIHKEMTFTFSGMVSNNVELTFPSELMGQCAVIDANNKEYLRIAASGESSTNPQFIKLTFSLSATHQIIARQTPVLQ